MLSLNGYSISKTSLDEKQLDKIKKELTMKPMVNFDMGNKKKEDEISFELYKETENRIRLTKLSPYSA